jgi:hypothetical protein
MVRRQFSAFCFAPPELVHPASASKASPRPFCVRLAGALLAALALSGCSPALNWRQVQLQELRAQLPCKPDQATRSVRLGEEAVSLEMAGCTADGALFAISRVEVASGATGGVMAAWRAHALAALQSSDAQPINIPVPAWAASHAALQAQGKSPEGRPVAARLTWLVREGRIYHLAVYAEHLSDSMTQPLLEDLQIL